MDNICKKIQNRESPNDVFLTPESLVKIHLEIVKPFYKNNDKILDGFYGKGIYYNMFPTYFKDCNRDFIEIEMGKDFFEYYKKIDMIVSNPPFSQIDNVFEKSVMLNPPTISYLIGAMNLTTRRIEYMEKNGYKLVKFHLTKVFKWFGMSCIVVFSKEGNSCLSYDRIIHK